MKKAIPEGPPLVLELVFPAEWRQPRNPLAEPAAAWTRTFLSDFGFLADPENDEKLTRLDVAGFGWPFYAAERPVLCTVTAFLTLWSLYASRRAARGEADEESLILAVRGEGPRPADPYHAAFWELGQRHSKRARRTFLARHGARFRAWLAATPAGDAAAAAFSGSLDEYLIRRRAQIGLLPILDFLELDLGEELPPGLWLDPRMSTVERLASELVALQHDLRAATAGGAVKLLMVTDNLSPAAAAAQLLARHNRLAAELDRVGRALLRDSRGESVVAAWWMRLGGLLAGFGSFYAAERDLPFRGPGGSGYDLRFGRDDEDDEPALTTGVWRVPRSFSAFAPPLAG